MLVCFERLIILLFCGYLNHKVMISPNYNNEMGSRKTDKPYIGGEVYNVNISRLLQTFLLSILVVYNSYIHHYFFDSYEILLILTLCIGYWLRIYSFKVLGHMFTFGLGIREDHMLVTYGPYQYLIHPGYTGQYMVHYSYWALLLLEPGLLSYIFGFLIIYSLIMLKKRVTLEENMMLEKFKEDYIEYKRTRYRFIPYIF